MGKEGIRPPDKPTCLGPLVNYDSQAANRNPRGPLESPLQRAFLEDWAAEGAATNDSPESNFHQTSRILALGPLYDYNELLENIPPPKQLYFNLKKKFISWGILYLPPFSPEILPLQSKKAERRTFPTVKSLTNSHTTHKWNRNQCKLSWTAHNKPPCSFFLSLSFFGSIPWFTGLRTLWQGLFCYLHISLSDSQTSTLTWELVRNASSQVTFQA